MKPLLVLALSCGAACAQTGDAGSAGFVFNLHGAWTSQRTGKAIRDLDPVFPKEQISAGRPSADSSLSISLYDGTPKTLRCRSVEDCDLPFIVPDTRPQPESLLARIAHALRALYPAEISRIQIPAVRGAVLEEAVVRILPNGKVDLAPALSGVPAGVYTVEFQPWQADGAASQPLAMHVEWRMSRALMTGDGQVAAGLYQLTLLAPNSESLGRAMILAASEANYPKLHEAFQRIRTLTGNWVPSSGEAAVRQFRAEYLIALERDPNLAGAQ
jgi:hypothetical protein